GVAKFMAPAVTGLGLVEAVSDADILAYTDENDSNSDGISGVASYVEAPDFFVPKAWNTAINGKYIGRFGRKATAIDLLHQTVNAYFNDMGITSDFHTEDIYHVQMGASSGDNAPEPEVGKSSVLQNVFYLQTLKVPPRRNENDAEVKAGEVLFTQIGCAACHRPSLKTQKHSIAALSEQTFYPYSDFLLHDLGAELDDKYTEGSATTAEWRTTPLWGLGLSSSSQGNQAYYLHDGRAKTLPQTIEYHGGEGANSRQAFRNLSETEKTKVLRFLESL
ncbi:MAG: di-heme oxidoredictase family protein, partial [Bacteroidia bacterium]